MFSRHPTRSLNTVHILTVIYWDSKTRDRKAGPSHPHRIRESRLPTDSSFRVFDISILHLQINQIKPILLPILPIPAPRLSFPGPSNPVQNRISNFSITYSSKYSICATSGLGDDGVFAPPPRIIHHRIIHQSSTSIILWNDRSIDPVRRDRVLGTRLYCPFLSERS